MKSQTVNIYLVALICISAIGLLSCIERNSMASEQDDSLSNDQEVDPEMLQQLLDFGVSDVEIGLKYSNEGYPRLAIESFTSAIEKNPNNYIAYYYRGREKYQLGKTLDAFNDYNKAIEIEPDFGDAYVARGLLKSKSDDWKGAIKDCEIAQTKSAGYMVLYCIGLARIKLNQIDNGCTAIEEIVYFKENHLKFKQDVDRIIERNRGASTVNKPYDESRYGFPSAESLLEKYCK